MKRIALPDGRGLTAGRASVSLIQGQGAAGRHVPRQVQVNSSALRGQPCSELSRGNYAQQPAHRPGSQRLLQVLLQKISAVDATRQQF